MPFYRHHGVAALASKKHAGDAESTEGTTLADLFYFWGCTTCIFPFASIFAVDWRCILELSCLPSNAGIWALRELKLKTHEDSAMIEV